MKQVIIVTAIATLIVVACVSVAVFVMLSQMSNTAQALNQPSAPYGSGNGPSAGVTPSAQGYGPGYGMMGGRGPMMGGPGAFGTPVVPQGYTAPTGGTGGFIAVTADGKAIPVSSDAPKLPVNTAAQKIGNLNVTLALLPFPPGSFQNGSFDITLVDDKGQAVTDATVSLDLTMPGMWMPPSNPNAQAVGNGKYHAAAFWTMRGLWQIELIITRGGQKQSAYFDVWL